MITDAEITELQSRGYVIVQKKSVILTDAQIKTLPTVRVTILPAPGVGKMIWPIFVSARMDWHGDYTNINATANVSLNTDPGGAITSFLENSVDSDVNLLFAGGGPDGVWGTFTPFQRVDAVNKFVSAVGAFYDSDIVNKDVFLNFNNVSSGNLTGGDPANSMKVTIYYVVVDFN